MSHAREWAEQYREHCAKVARLQHEGPLRLIFSETYSADWPDGQTAVYGMMADVTDEGHMRIRTFHTGEATLSPERAIAYARWILEIFSEGGT